MSHSFFEACALHDKTFKKPAHTLTWAQSPAPSWARASRTSLPQHLDSLAQLITLLFKHSYPELATSWRASLTASKSTPGRVYLALQTLPESALQHLISSDNINPHLDLKTFSAYALNPLPCKLSQIHQWLCHPSEPLHPSEGLGLLVKQAYKHCARLAAQWIGQLPPWYEIALFHQWNQQQLRSLNPTGPRPVTHPFQHHLLHSLLTSKPPQIQLRSPFDSNHPLLKSKISISPELIAYLWAMPLDPLVLKETYPQLAQDYAQQHLDQWLPALAERWSSDFLKSMSVTDTSTWHTLLWSAFHRICRQKYAPSEQEQALVSLLKQDLRTHQHRQAAQLCKQDLPTLLPDYYPLARTLQRNIKIVLGPTNSGKTHAALEALARSRSGAYLGPLRLLALEVYDRLNDDYSVPTSLITGEQIIIQSLDGHPAPHQACTVEMLDYTTPRDVIVIDEAQMLQDPQRGSAWLHAILGAPAKTVYILGAPEARHALEHLMEATGEPYSIEIKQRLSAPVVVAPQPATSLDVPKGSALIAFSRKKVLMLAESLKSKGRVPAVIYGSLPPDVRRKQSELFATGKADVLIATDAIGLGLNLPISRIYFSSVTKSDGISENPLDPHLLWQIAGRAGRFGHSETGSVHAFSATDLTYIQQCLSTRPEPLPLQFYCNLTAPIASKIAEHLATQRLTSVYAFFKDYIELTTHKNHGITANVSDEQILLAKLLDQHPALSLTEKLLLSNAPAVYRDLDPHFSGFLLAIAKNKEYPTLDFVRNLTPTAHTSLADLESAIKSLNLWAWVHYRFEHVFLHKNQVADLQNTINNRIHSLLISNAKKHAAPRNSFRPSRVPTPTGPR